MCDTGSEVLTEPFLEKEGASVVHLEELELREVCKVYKVS